MRNTVEIHWGSVEVAQHTSLKFIRNSQNNGMNSHNNRLILQATPPHVSMAVQICRALVCLNLLDWAPSLSIRSVKFWHCARIAYGMCRRRFGTVLVRLHAELFIMCLTLTSAIGWHAVPSGRHGHAPLPSRHRLRARIDGFQKRRLGFGLVLPLGTSANQRVFCESGGSYYSCPPSLFFAPA